ncbi:hypothetical protein QCA50_009828 [Cerrena zonata]|uniref:Uncharacterized protein n=1 Tax=Cerrena zonata TaxID=2478898 RepID=A0AAW0G4K7_9APHY
MNKLETLTPAEVYQQNLSELGYGAPLWRPEPTGRKGRPRAEVFIGDVGRINPSDGSWDRFFNVLKPASHQCNAEGVPKSFEVLDPAQTHPPRISPGQLAPQVYSSRTIHNKAFTAKGAGGSGGVKGSIITQYECTSDSGALLALQDAGNQEVVEDNLDWIEYMEKHHYSWYQWATREPRRWVVNKEDIVLVRGWVKADKWSLASFENQGQAMSFALVGEVPYFSFGGSLSIEHQINRPDSRRTSRTFTTVPSAKPAKSSKKPPKPRKPLLAKPHAPTNCVFLLTYNAKYRTLGRVPSVMKAQAQPTKPPNDRFSDDDSEGAARMESSVEIDPDVDTGHHKLRLPVDRVLDHLLKASPGADIAITPNTFLHPQTGKPIEINCLSEEELQQLFPSMLTRGGAATVNFEAQRDECCAPNPLSNIQHGIKTDVLSPCETPEPKVTTATHNGQAPPKRVKLNTLFSVLCLSHGCQNKLKERGKVKHHLRIPRYPKLVEDCRWLYERVMPSLYCMFQEGCFLQYLLHSLKDIVRIGCPL